MSEAKSSLTALLDEAGLLCYEQKMRALLKLREASDIVYVDEKDFLAIGMTRPEQKRLRAAYHRLFPRATIMGKLKKKLLGNASDSKKTEVVQTDEEQHVIPLERIELGKELGKGEFGSVYQAVWMNSNGERVQVAVKCVSTLKLLANSSNFLQEAAIMHKMRHEYVVRLYGVVLDTKTVMLVSELASCGSLLECLRTPALKETFFIDTLCDFAVQVASGMKYLANKRLIHRDLAARNVLVFSPSKVKIADFGLSRLLGVGEYYYRGDFTEGMKLPIAWCAPESINFLRFTSASDVWSFGVTLYEIFSYGQTPWAGLTGTEILSAVDCPRNERLPCPELCPTDIYMLMQQCWAYKPEERPSFSDIMDQLTDVSPQSVVTVSICNDGVGDHLQHGKNEVVIVLDKQPPAYPDGYYWMGCMRDGRKGLFRPANTVARLGAENPCGRLFHISSPIQNGSINDREKEKDRGRKKKVVISEPQNDLRHTCHIGIDGTSFGMIPGAEKLQNPAFSPSNSSSSTVLCSPFPSSSQASSPLPQSSNYQPSNRLNSEATTSQTVSNTGRTSSCSTAITSLSDFDSTCGSVFTDQLLVALPRTTKPFRPAAALPYKPGGIRNEAIRHDSHDSVDDDASTITEVLNEMNLIATDFSLSSIPDDVSESRPLLDFKPPRYRKPAEVLESSDSSVCRVMSEGELERWEGRVDREHKKASKILGQERHKETDLLRRASMTTKSERSDEKLSRSFSNSMTTKAPLEWSEEAQNAYKLLVQCGNDLKYGSIPSSIRKCIRKEEQLDETKMESKATRSDPVSLAGAGIETKKDEGKESILVDEDAGSVSGDAHPALAAKLGKIEPAEQCDFSPLRQLRSASGPSGLKFQKVNIEAAAGSSRNGPSGSSPQNKLTFDFDDSKASDASADQPDKLPSEGQLQPPTAQRPLPPRPAPRLPPPVPPKPKKRVTRNLCEEYPASQGGFASAVANSTLFSGVKNEEVLNF